jgi:hypothetical protein
MFLGTAIDMNDPELVAARASAEAVLLRGAAAVQSRGASDDATYGPLAAFALVHGLATLWNNDAVAERYRARGVEQLARDIGSLLFAQVPR